MSLPSVLARIADLDAAFSPPAARVRTPPASASAPPASAAAPAVAAPSRSAFSSLLAAAGPGGGGRPAIVQAAASQLGVAEQPPGSNDSPAIARYRAAVAGNPGPGPW